MMFQRCSDVVESRAEHAIRCRKPQGCSFTSHSEQPRRAGPWATRGLDDDSVCRAGLSIDEVDDLSIDHIMVLASQRSTTKSWATANLIDPMTKRLRNLYCAAHGKKVLT